MDSWNVPHVPWKFPIDSGPAEFRSMDLEGSHTGASPMGVETPAKLKQWLPNRPLFSRSI